MTEKSLAASKPPWLSPTFTTHPGRAGKRQDTTCTEIKK